MKRFFIAIAVAAAGFAPASAEARNSLEGRWQNGRMEIVIAPCGSNLCGTVVKASPTQQAKAERGSGTDLVGARLITGITATGPGTYKARVFVADQNVHASGTIRQVNSNQLNVRGCVLAVICKSKTWDRIR
jgi:uncharacterized protein (DUF2147 family)